MNPLVYKGFSFTLEKQNAWRAKKSSNFRNPKSEIRNPKSEIRNPKSEIRNPKSEIRNPKSEIRNPKSEIRNPKSEIRNPKSEIRNPKSEIRGGLTLKTVLRKALICFFYITISNHLWAQGGTTGKGESQKRPASQVQSVENPAPKRVKRPLLFPKTVQAIERNVRKAGKKICLEIIELSTSLNCICLDDDVLDEMGDLGQTFCGLSIHSKDDESSCNSPLESVEQTVPDPPPSYEQVFPDIVIESVLMQVHHRCRVLHDAGCIRLVVEELERVLSRHPGHQGKKLSLSSAVSGFAKALHSQETIHRSIGKP